MALFRKKANLIKEDNKLICHILFVEYYDTFCYIVPILYTQNCRQKNISKESCRQDPILPIRQVGFLDEKKYLSGPGMWIMRLATAV